MISNTKRQFVKGAPSLATRSLGGVYQSSELAAPNTTLRPFYDLLHNLVRQLVATSSPQQFEKLEAALRRRDELQRKDRMERIIWLSNHECLPGVIIGRTETMHLLREARAVFVDGHFAATLLLAISVINHCLVEVLQLRDEIKGDPGFDAVLTRAEQLGVLPPDWFDPLRLLASRRHPFVHFKDSEHKHALGARVLLEQKTPAAILQTDAELAVEYMYLTFRETLREAA